MPTDDTIRLHSGTEVPKVEVGAEDNNKIWSVLGGKSVLQTPDQAGIVTKTGDQSIGGNKEFEDNIDFEKAAETEEAFMEEWLHWKMDFLESAAALASTTLASVFWTGGGTSGTQAVAADSGRGILRLDTTDTGSRTSTATGEPAVDTSKNTIYKFRIATDALTNRKIEAGLQVDSNDYLLLRFDSAVDGDNIYLATDNNNAGEVEIDTGVDLVAGTYIEVEIEINGSDQTFEVSINGIDVDLSSAGTIRSLATFKPYFYVDNKTESQSNKLDIDYVEIARER